MGKGSNTTTGTSTQKTGPTAAVLKRYQDMLNRVWKLGDQDYQGYDGQRVAGFNRDQKAAFQGVRDAQGIYQPYLDKAGEYTEMGARPVYETYQNYLNPYTHEVVDATQRSFDASNKEQQSQVVGNAVLRGAMGGDRVGVAQGEAVRQQKLAQDPVIAGLYSQGYDKSIAAAQQDALRFGQAGQQMANLGYGAQNAAYTDANALYGMGATQQQNQQANLDVAYKDFLEKRGYPTQQATWMAGILAGLGPQMGTRTSGTTTTTTPPPNPWSTALGIGTTLGGAYLSGGSSLFAPAAAGVLTGGAPLGQGGIGHAASGGRVERRATGGGIMLPYAEEDSLGIPVSAIPPAQVRQPPSMPSPAAPASSSSPSVSDMLGQALGLAETIKGYGGAEPFTSASLESSAGGVGGGVRGAASGPSGDPSQPRGVRNNNPGNIEDGPFARSIPGYVGSDGRFARYDSPAAGFTAMDRLLQSYAAKGINTPSGIINRWAPANDGNPVNAYAAHIANGADPSAPIDMNDPAVRQAIADRMAQFENGRVVPRGYGGAVERDPRGIYIPRRDVGGSVETPTAKDDYEAWGSLGLGAAPPVMSFAPQEAPAMVAPEAPAPRALPSAGIGAGSFFGNLPPELGRSLMAAGLGMMASKSPNLGNAIGEGGLVGLQTFSAMKEQGRKSEEAKASAALKARELSESASRAAATLAETSRHNRATEENSAATTAATLEGGKVPSGFQRSPNGALTFIPGGPNDPSYRRLVTDKQNAPPGYKWKDPNNPEAGLEAIVGGPAEKITPEVAARIGLAKSFLGQLEDYTDRDGNVKPGIRSSIKAGDVTGFFGGPAGALNYGKAGELKRLISSGSEALLRNLTGAGMNMDEARKYIKRYEPEINDSADTLLSKVDQLERELRSVNDVVGQGRGGTSIGTVPHPAATPAPGAITKQQYDALPSGAKYIAPDGSPRTKQ